LDLAGGLLILMVLFWKAFAVLFWGQSAMKQQFSRVLADAGSLDFAQ
jgi:hypothetical protein